MKYIFSIFITIVSLSLFSFISFDRYKITEDNFLAEAGQINVPDNVMAVLNRSCLPCHGTDGSGKAKMKWNWEKMSEYSKTKMISKLVKVAEKVEDGKMPPPKKVKKHPQMKLTPEDKDLLMTWADNAASQLTGHEE